MDRYITHISEAASAFGVGGIDVPRQAKYLADLYEKNTVMNLTAITEPKEMAVRHTVDSLALIKLGIIDPEQKGSILDVGTGGGTPGIPLAIALPSYNVTLNDPMKKRCNFLREAIEGLENAEVLEGRAEELAKEPLRESFDIVTARAVASLGTLCEYCLPFVKVGGIFAPMKSGDIEEELAAAANAIKVLGGQLEELLYYEIPGEGVRRAVPVIRKIAATHKAYPRRTPKIKAAPL